MTTPPLRNFVERVFDFFFKNILLTVCSVSTTLLNFVRQRTLKYSTMSLKQYFLIPLRLEMLYNPKNVYKKFDGPGTSDNSYIEDFLIFLTCFSVGQWPATSGQKNEKTGRPWPASFPKNDK